MMVHVPNVLTAEQDLQCREVMEKAAWVDGRVTAGHQSAKVKNNLQLPENSAEARELGTMVVEALAKNNLFMSAVLPKQVFPPLFNRYDAGMTFGAHVDNAIRGVPNSGIRIRTDVSSTLFISRPDDYDGGELVVEDTYGTHNVKLPAGDMIVYPATSLHYVTPITRGSRIASFFWTQSMIRDESKRSLLFDMDMAIIKLQRDHPDHVSLVELTSIYHNCSGSGLSYNRARLRLLHPRCISLNAHMHRAPKGIHMYTMSQASLPAFEIALNALSGVLDKAAAYALAKKVDPSILLGWRLAPDMFALGRQIQVACDQAKNGSARLAGVEPPKFDDTETTLEQFKERIARTIGFLRTLDGKAIDASSEREVTFPLGQNKGQMKGCDYLNHFVLPNFYFHVTAAYAVVRNFGVDVSKRDFIGAIPLKLV